MAKLLATRPSIAGELTLMGEASVLAEVWVSALVFPVLPLLSLWASLLQAVLPWRWRLQSLSLSPLATR
jgi:hypothetical protein